MSGIHHPVPFLLIVLLLAILVTGGCSDPDTADSPADNQNNALTRDPFADAPADWAEFLTWAGQKLESQTSTVPIPTSPKVAKPTRPLVRLDDPTIFQKARKTCDWTATPLGNGALATLGPLRSDRQTSTFVVKTAPKASPDGEDSLALMIGGFNIRGEDVGSIELTLRVPFGKHVSLAWSMMGNVLIPVESHDEPFTVRVLTDGLADWKGPREIISVITDGLGKGVVEIRSLRFLPRTRSYPRPTAVQRVRLGHEIRTAIYTHCPTEITYENITLPPNANLRTGLGHVATPDANHPPRTRFQVIVTYGGTQQTILDSEVDIGRTWIDTATSLATWAGKPVTLTLKTTSTAPDAVAFWANPLIYQPIDDPPILVIYLIDTVAAEHVGFQGYSRTTMPRLAEMAAGDVWFSRMFSNSSRTIESIPDLMLSMPTERHGVHHNSTSAPQGLVTIADALRAAGLATVSFCTNVNAGPRQGMDQGFDTFVDKISSHLDNVDRTIPLEEVMTWISHNRDRPMFLYIHTAEPHSPYTPLEGFRDRFDPDYTGKYTGVGFHDARNPRDLAHLRALYDEEIVYADARFGLFLDALQKEGLLDKTHFFVTTDHGEEFLQHNDWEHGRNLHNEQTRILLVAFGPTFSNRGKVDTPAQLYDLMPTVLDMFDLPAPYPLSGQSLLPILQSNANEGNTLVSRDIYASNHNFRIEYNLIEYSVIENCRWKLLFGAAGTPMYRGGPDSRFMLFDLAADPRERKNLMHSRQDITRRLAEKLVRWRLNAHVYDPGKKTSTIIDPTHMAELQALGYVGDNTAPDNINEPPNKDESD